ncbi:MAG: membrane protein insertion efficiency factor YidD [Patescibacteria group bacterium]|nr:membrane protein insertion efficiency factor YidD [Patescibacteria group bacterium]
MKSLVLWLIRFYQRYLNPKGFFLRFLFLTDRSCRFVPTCSQYTLEAVEKYGVAGGLVLGLKRILSCHPFSKGGADPLK